MSKTATLTLMTLLSTLLFTPTSEADSVSGHGTFQSGKKFVFDAKGTGTHGDTTGKARLYDGGLVSMDFDLDCLIVHGNTAILGGSLTDSPSTSYAFKVTDNGGGETLADRITLPQKGQTCANFNTLGNSNLAITSGDIEVQDMP
jgi:hypothetical protein